MRSTIGDITHGTCALVKWPYMYVITWRELFAGCVLLYIFGPLFLFLYCVCIVYILWKQGPLEDQHAQPHAEGATLSNTVSLSSSSSSSWTRATVTHINHGIIVVVSWVEVITVPFGSQVNVFHVHGDRAVILFVNTCCHNNHIVQSRDLRRAGQRVERKRLHVLNYYSL